MNATPSSGEGFTRRGFLGTAAAAAALPLLAACTTGASPSTSSGSGGPGDPVKFWDMQWGTTSYIAEGKALVAKYAPKAGLASPSYQSIAWTNFYQTFASAIASKTGPAVSSGSGYQAFQFAGQGAIAAADDVVSGLKKDGEFEDFLPGTFDFLNTKNGYVGVPWQLDMRVLTYRKPLLEKAGVGVPTDWDSLLTAGKALKKIGVVGFGTGAGTGSLLGGQTILGLMINNGGGWFDPDGKPDCVTERNIETLQFLQELSRNGIMDPAAISYTGANLNKDWLSGKIGMGFNNVPSVGTALGGTDILVASPLKGPHGDMGALYYVNNLMMYTNTPSQESSNAFLRWYLDNMKDYWQKGVISAIPVRKSIVQLPEFQKDANSVKAVAEWQPISKTFASLGTKGNAALNAIEGGTAFTTFSQQVIQGQSDPKTILETLQKGLQAAVIGT